MATTSRKSRTQPPEFSLLAQRLNVWRADPTRGQRIPEDLWKAAADLARVHGLSRTATELKLNYCQLRRRVSDVSWMGRPEPTPQFVELTAPMPSAEVDQHGTLELVQPWGRLTLRLPHASPRELLPLVQLFVRRRS